MTRTEFEHTVSGMRKKLRDIAGRFTRISDAAESAEDIVQEALAELWAILEKGYPARNVEALAVKITKTVCVRHYRKRRILTDSMQERDFTGGTPASEKVDLQEALETRTRLFSRLSDTERLYLTLRNECQMSLDEIASATGHPKSSVKATISQARRKMNEEYKKMSV